PTRFRSFAERHAWIGAQSRQAGFKSCVVEMGELPAQWRHDGDQYRDAARRKIGDILVAGAGGDDGLVAQFLGCVSPDGGYVAGQDVRPAKWAGAARPG